MISFFLNLDLNVIFERHIGRHDGDRSRSPERRDNLGRHSHNASDTHYSKRSESRDGYRKRYALDKSDCGDDDGKRHRSRHSRNDNERDRSTSPLRVRPE